MNREAPVSALGVSLPTVAELELWILGAYYGIYHQGVDRGPDSLVAPDPETGAIVSTVEPVSGFTSRACFRKATYNAVAGETLAMGTPLDFWHWTCAFMCRRDETTGRTFTLDMIHRDDWIEEEKERHAVLMHRMKMSVARMAGRGLFDTQPVFGPDGERYPLGDDGLPALAKITWRGLQEAIRRVSGTRFEARATSKLETAPDAIRVAAPAHSVQEWMGERRAPGLLGGVA